MAHMRILTTRGVEDVELETFNARSIVGSHWNAVQRLLYKGETDELERFAGIRIRGRQLLTDPDEIERQARIGELDVDDIYEDER
jgi:hypothetical protein